jgi:hypothetical protein
MSISLVPATKDSLKAEARSWSDKANALTIPDREACVNVSFLLRSIKGVMQDIDTAFQPELDEALERKRTADAERKRIVDERDAIKLPLVQAEPIIKRKLLDFEQAQERARLAEERRLQEEARKHAESVTLAVAADLELQAAATGDAEMLDEAHAILAQPIEAPVVSVKATMPRVQGITYRDCFKAHPQVDVKALAGAVAAGIAPASFLVPNWTAINQFARATQGAQKVPGLQFFNDRSIAARG